MKKQTTWYYALLLLVGLVVAQTLKAQAPPLTFTDLGAGTQTLDNDTVKSTGKWYKWIADTGVVYAGVKLKQNGTSHQLAQAELYTVSSGSLVLMFRDSLEADTINLLKLYAGYVSPSAEIYIHVLNAASSCTACTVTDPVVQIEVRNIMQNCDPVTPCDLVKNGGFEGLAGDGCGPTVTNAECWFKHQGTADVFHRGCTANGGIFNLGLSTWNFTATVNSHNLAPNNTVVGMAQSYNSITSTYYSESVQSLLFTPLVSGHKYELSFWVFNYAGPAPAEPTGSENPMYYNCWVTFASSPNSLAPSAFPGTANVINRFHVTPKNSWTQYTYTFTFSGASNYNILVGPDLPQNVTYGYINSSNNQNFYIFIDDVSIQEITPITVTGSYNHINCANNPATATLTASGTGLGSFTWEPGTMTGSVVVVSPTVTTIYTVTSTYANGCTVSNTYTVNILPLPVTTISASPSASICPGATVTLSTPGLTFSEQIHNMWTPCSSGCTTASLAVTPTTTTTYTVKLYSTNGCTNTAQTTVTVLTPSNAITVTGNTIICTGGQTTTLTAHGGSSYTWSPGGATTASISVTPTVTTNYTVVGTYACGTATTVTTVSVQPPPALTVTASPTVVCAGNPATLTASGAITYTWNPGLITGNGAVVSPTSTTVYTVTGVNINGCTGTGTVTIAVNPIPTQSISPPSSTICPGNSVILGIGGKSTNVVYAWSTGVTTNSITVSPSGTTVYSVTITNTITGCSVVKTATVTVVPSLTVAVNSATICSGSTATLTASGATTYTWSTGATTASVALSPTVTSGYTVAGTYSAGCTATMVTTVYVLPSGSFSVATSISNTYPVSGSTVALTSTVTPPGSNYTYTWSPIGINTASAVITPTDNAVYVLSVSNGCGTTVVSSLCSSIQSTLCSSSSYTVLNSTAFTNTTVTFNNRIITITGTITVTNGSLSFYNCTLKMGANAKISLDPTSQIVVATSKLFSCEGMWYGIEAQSSSVSSASVSVRGSRIEDAFTAIVTNNSGTTRDNNVYLSSSTFNKNYTDVLLQNWLNAGATYSFSSQACLYASQATNTSPGSSLKCSSFYSPSVKDRSFAGIYATNATSVNITTTSTGSLSANLFSNKDYGIALIKTSGHVSNALFNDLKGINGNCNGIGCTPPTPTGIGIYATSSSTIAPTLSVTATYAPVTFSNVQCAIYTKKLGNLYALNTSITNSAQNNWTTNAYGSGYGYNGIYTEDTRRDVHINSNTIQNAWYGAQAAFTGTVGLNILSISNNTVTASSSSYTTTIGVNISSASPSNFNGSPSSMPIAANSISGVLSGIRLTGLTGGVRVSGNSIDLQSGNAFGGNGIWLDGANTYCKVDNNSINGNATGAENTFNLNKVGITVRTSTDCKVQCNSITNTGTGARYDGISTSPGDGFFNNALTYPIRRGLELRNSASMGTQGSYTGTPPTHTVTSVSKNQWAGTWNSGNSDQTYIFDAGSNAATGSRMCTGTSSSELPSDNQWNTGASVADAYGTANYALLTSSTATANTTCVSPLTVGQRIMGENDSLATMERDAEYKRIITQSLTDSTLSDESKWQLKGFMFSNIATGNAPYDQVVRNFYAEQQNSSINDLNTVDSLIREGNYLQATSVNSSVSGNLIVEQTTKNYNDLWLSKFSDPEYIATIADIISIQEIADLCIHKGGKSVAYARALLGAIYNHPFKYDDNCMADQENNRIAKSNKNSVTKTNSVNLYPNPNNGNFTMNYSLKEVDKVEVMIEDITGKLVFTSKLDVSMQNKTIELGNVRSGIYFVKVMSGKQIIAVNKVIINN